MNPVLRSVTMAAALLMSGDALAESFVNFESGHTRPLSLSPSGDLLFAVNTPNNSLSIFEVDGSGLELAAQVPVGLEPVAVASRVNTSTGRTEAWVVNHLSDSVSVVEIDAANLPVSRVKHTLLVGDEPRDIVFGGSPVAKAFITTARRGQNLPESVGAKLNEKGVPRALVWAFEAQNVGAGVGGAPVAILELFGDTPRALALSPGGSTVYAAVFHSGNQTTSIRDMVVEANGGPPPPPADSPFFGDPDIVRRSLIVKFDEASGEWNDEIGRDWSEHIDFSLPDKDVFAIDADANPPVVSAAIQPYRHVGTTLFNMAVRPGTGSVFVTNSDARNEVRFEPIAAGGVQGHATDERITVLSGASVLPVDVNPHIDHSVATGPPGEADDSLALLGEVVFSSDGSSLYAAAMGSDRVAVFDADALEAGTSTRDLVDVGRGPSGLVLDEANDNLYVMNRLDHTISIVSNASDAGLRAQTSAVSVGFDPTPEAILEGRPFLYDARTLSGHGDQSCASCHTFGDADQLAWDLGNPYGALEDNPNPLLPLSPEVLPELGPVSPLKGPMVTQSLRGMADAGPMHWRGDRTAASDPGGDALDEDGAFKKFNPAFVDLLGRVAPLDPDEMQAFTDFVLTLRYPPNPIRALDNQLTRGQEVGFENFVATNVDNFGGPCALCHGMPLGTQGLTLPGPLNSFKVAHLRATYQKVGRFGGERFQNQGGFAGDQVRGFGILHDGTVQGPVEFASGFIFRTKDEEFGTGPLVGEFLLAFDTGLAPAVGQQVTIGASPPGVRIQRLDLLVGRDAAGDCDLTFSGRIGGAPRLGSVLPGGRVMLDDSEAALLDAASVLALAGSPGGEQTYTCRPPGTGSAATVDRDDDGVLDGDEAREGTDPFDAASVPYDCVGGETIDAAKMKITKNQLPHGDEKLSIRAESAAAPSDFDPSVDGLNVVLRRTSGEIVLHQSLPASRWSTEDGERFTYEGAEGAVIPKAKLGPGREGGLKLDLKGKAGEFAVDTADLVLEIVLGGDGSAASGRCVTGTFGAAPLPACELSSKKLKCG